jgi:hypothetical protein
VNAAIAETLTASRARLSAADQARFASAIRYAAEAHNGQLRDGGRPALLHALRVANGLLTQPAPVSANVLSAAVLHDVVEDTNRGLREVRARFGPEIARLVHAVTLDPVERFPSKEARDRAYYARFKDAPRGAHRIKYFDRLDNIRDMASWGPEGRLGYLESTKAKVIASLRPHSPDLARALEAEVNKKIAEVEAELARAARGINRFRRADGTLRWKPYLAERARVEGAGLAHFTLALFLKELAVVLQTGDRLRFEEFFEGLASTDFFAHYGLFAVGARAGEVAYARVLAKHVKPRFVSGLLRTNVVLAAGLALPELIRGTFEGEAFAISVASLGLSSAAVEAGLVGLRAVLARPAAGAAGRLGLGLRLGKLAGPAGWIATVAQTAVVLYLADGISARITAWKDAREAKGALADAGLAFFAAVQDPDLSSADLDAALETYLQAWDDYRAFLRRPLDVEEALLQQRLTKLARRAKLDEDARATAASRLGDHAALRAHVERRHGSIAGYAASRGDDELTADVEAALASYERSRRTLAAELFRAAPRPAPYLDGVDLSAASLGEAPAAWNVFARWGRGRAAVHLRDALSDLSETWPGSLADQEQALARAAALLSARPELGGSVEATRARLAAAANRDATLTGSAGLGGALPR